MGECHLAACSSLAVRNLAVKYTWSSAAGLAAAQGAGQEVLQEMRQAEARLEGWELSLQFGISAGILRKESIQIILSETVTGPYLNLRLLLFCQFVAQVV